ncbi:G/U mismatch-specific uracil-DNA glycosylase [Roseiarcus fermentans]|uniref:G/U mismatch-specific uracil-DNA glycosylase n=1 Tax=Roseiarcus fermentans TaxID=1473586 RepID=A0A366F0P0_9HYPH|nr:DNA-deoxyinosine glycosylase [Roseiarcus fermentans]RBP08232.1 G/U mismatch-specific uracil-DNA glycosylase [Roseiarcus fermentans]
MSELTADVGFDPIAAPAGRVLILGTLPGGESLKRKEYYAFRSNVFWRVMETLVGAAADSPYELRRRRLCAAGIAVWDVCKSAKRPGSLDARIDRSSIVANDFAAFFASHPDIRIIGFNGRTAAHLYQTKVLPGLPSALGSLQRVILPSTSSANAMRFDDKILQWRSALAHWIAPTNPS